jgi:hypothetical protein
LQVVLAKILQKINMKKVFVKPFPTAIVVSINRNEHNNRRNNMFKLNEIATTINNAPSGSFVGITDYISDKGDVTSITGQIGVSYSNAKEKAVNALKTAIEAKDFVPITVQGLTRENPDNKGEFNSRKRSWPMVSFKVKFTKAQVIAIAEQVLESYVNSEKKNNKVQLSEKENGLYLESETDNINVSLLVQNQTYKELESQVAKANLGKVDKPKATMPENLLKEIIRKRFMPRYKAYTLKSDNFKKLSIGGQTYE